MAPIEEHATSSITIGLMANRILELESQNRVLGSRLHGLIKAAETSLGRLEAGDAAGPNSDAEWRRLRRRLDDIKEETDRGCKN